MHDSTTFPLYPVQQGKLWEKICTFLIATGRYLLTRLIYSLYRPRLLPRPSLHYSCIMCAKAIIKLSMRGKVEVKLEWDTNVTPPIACNFPWVHWSRKQACMSFLEGGQCNAMCKMWIVRLGFEMQAIWNAPKLLQHTVLWLIWIPPKLHKNHLFILKLFLQNSKLH